MVQNQTSEGISNIPPYLYFYATVFCIVAVLGTMGNICVIASMLFTANLRTMRNSFIVNLALSDLLVCTVTMPATLVGILKGDIFYEDHWFLCQLTSLICGPTCMVSMYSCVMIAVIRYFYIGRYPTYLKYFTSTKIIIYIVVLWSFCIAICLPNHFGWGKVQFSQVLNFCWLDTETYSYLAFYTVIKIMAIFISLYFYSKLYSTIRHSSLAVRMITTKDQKAESGDIKRCLHEVISNKNMNEEIKIIAVSFKIFVLFSVCWSPLIILFLLTAIYSGPTWLYLFASFIGHSNSTLNFVVYFWDNNVFKDALMKAIRSKLPNKVVPLFTTVYSIKVSGVKKSQS